MTQPAHLPDLVCAWCRSTRGPDGQWVPAAAPPLATWTAQSHGICPTCAAIHYPAETRPTQALSKCENPVVRPVWRRGRLE